MQNYKTYKSREEAGKVLAGELEKLSLQNPYLIAIPRGGIQVAQAIADRFNIPINVIVTKKLPVPGSPETGFGAITEDGHRVFNEDYLGYLNLTGAELEEICQGVISEIKHRVDVYGSYDKEKIRGADVIVVDDGVATGYSLIAALMNVRSYNPKSVIAAVPVCSAGAYQKIKANADTVVCPIVDSGTFFAVGYFYEDFSNLSEAEIQKILKKYRKDS